MKALARNQDLNQSFPRHGMLLVCCAVFAFLIGSFSVTSAQTQDAVDEGRNALSNKTYPWYDAEKDGVRRVDLGKRPESRSAKRNEIPVQPLKPPAPPAKPWNWGNWNWGWGGGFSQMFAGGLSGVTWAILITLILVVVGVLIWAVSRMNSNPDLVDDAAPKRSMEESIKQLPFELESTNGDFRQQAQAAYRNGDYRKAITYLFSHVLVSLDQKGLIRLRKGKTNRQYLRELRSHRPLANYYQHVMVPFESVFFGDHELGQSEFENCWNQLDQFQTGVEQSSQVANV